MKAVNYVAGFVAAAPIFSAILMQQADQATSFLAGTSWFLGFTVVCSLSGAGVLILYFDGPNGTSRERKL